MTNIPIRRKSDISPEDALDGWLNARMSGSNDNTTQLEGESLAGAAHEFHAWAEGAQQADPAATGPADDLWNEILGGRGRLHVDPAQTDRNGEEMERTVHAPMGGYAPPKSNRTRRAQAAPSPSRSGAWFNAIAAALLLLTLGGGAYLASDGRLGIGGGGNDGGRFAAQVVSPEASPAGDRAMCDVEPLATDEIMAYVKNPYSLMTYGYLGTPSPGDREAGVMEATEGLLEPPVVQGARPESTQLRVPTEEEFAEALAVADDYYACMVHGTRGQVWALKNPVEVQREILNQFPVYRDRETIKAYVEAARIEPVVSDPSMNAWTDGSEDGRRTYPNPNLSDARVYEKGLYWVFPDADMLLYIGEEYRDESESVVALSSWDAMPLVGSREELNGGQAIILVHSASTGKWFYYGVTTPQG